MGKISRKKDLEKPLHIIKDIRFVNDCMQLWIDGKEYSFLLKKISKTLYHASEIERLAYKISASGYGIHWPLIDEDLSIDGLLGIQHYPPSIKHEYPHENRVVVRELTKPYKTGTKKMK